MQTEARYNHKTTSDRRAKARDMVLCSQEAALGADKFLVHAMPSSWITSSPLLAERPIALNHDTSMAQSPISSVHNISQAHYCHSVHALHMGYHHWQS